MTTQTPAEVINITAIYEDGVLRPLEPLDLPEYTEVRLTVTPIVHTVMTRDEQLDAIFAAAGIHFVKMPTDGLRMLTDEERDALGRRIGPGRPLSEVIIEERENGP